MMMSQRRIQISKLKMDPIIYSPVISLTTLRVIKTVVKIWCGSNLCINNIFIMGELLRKCD